MSDRDRNAGRDGEEGHGPEVGRDHSRDEPLDSGLGDLASSTYAAWRKTTSQKRVSAPASESVSAHGAQKPSALALRDSDELAAQTYRMAQAQRVSGRASTVEAIMLAIRNDEQVGQFCRSSLPEQAASQSANRNHGGKAATPSTTGSRWRERWATVQQAWAGHWTQPGRHDAGANWSDALRYAVPAGAAFMLALIIVPKLTGPAGTSSLALPPALTTEVVTVRDYLRVEQPLSLAFQADESAEKTAFARGLLATAVTAGLAIDDPDTRAWLRQRLLLQAERDAQPALAILTRQTLLDADTAQDAHADDAAVALVALLSLPAREQGAEDWFKQGEMIEAIGLAADVGLATGDAEALQDLLTRHAQTSLPSSDLPASRLLRTLSERAGENVRTLNRIRAVSAEVRTIKVLMNSGW